MIRPLRRKEEHAGARKRAQASVSAASLQYTRSVAAHKNAKEMLRRNGTHRSDQQDGTGIYVGYFMYGVQSSMMHSV